MSEESTEPAGASAEKPKAPKATKRAATKTPAKRASKTATKKKAVDGNGSKKPATKKAVSRKKAASSAPSDDLFPPAPEVSGGGEAPVKRQVKRVSKAVKEVAPSASEERSTRTKKESDAPKAEATDAPKPEIRRESDAPERRPERRSSQRDDRPTHRGESEGPRREDRGGGNDRRSGNERRDSEQGDAPPRDRDSEGGDYERRGRNRRKRWKDRKRDRRRDSGPRGSDEHEAEDRQPEVPQGPPEPSDGILELSPKGYGFLRRRAMKFAQHPQDAFVTADMIREFGLREGMQVTGEQCKGQRGPQVTKITEINHRKPEELRDMPLFEELKAVNPNKKIQLETTPDRLTTRVMDLVTPVGRGQRGLIVAPPRAGKTTLLQHIAEAIVKNHPQMHLMVLLVDERPEEVTEFKRVLPEAEIFASSNDMDVPSHVRIAQFAIERAKRLVEMGEHVFILMDSITRMARAFNNSKGKSATGSGGIAVGALEIPRRLFAAARNTRTAGSLTILATALVETGSRGDEVIFQEFKGTGNLELVLDRRIAEQFFYPAVDIFKSGTRREELLLQGFQLEKIRMLRRGLAGHKPIEAIQRVITLLERYPNNAQMLIELPSK